MSFSLPLDQVEAPSVTSIAEQVSARAQRMQRQREITEMASNSVGGLKAGGAQDRQAVDEQRDRIEQRRVLLEQRKAARAATTVVLSGHGDPGYTFTAVGLAETALCLAGHVADCAAPSSFGVLTADLAVQRHVLVNRLEALGMLQVDMIAGGGLHASDAADDDDDVESAEDATARSRLSKLMRGVAAAGDVEIEP